MAIFCEAIAEAVDVIGGVLCEAIIEAADDVITDVVLEAKSKVDDEDTCGVVCEDIVEAVNDIIEGKFCEVDVEADDDIIEGLANSEAIDVINSVIWGVIVEAVNDIIEGRFCEVDVDVIDVIGGVLCEAIIEAADEYKFDGDDICGVVCEDIVELVNDIIEGKFCEVEADDDIIEGLANSEAIDVINSVIWGAIVEAVNDIIEGRFCELDVDVVDDVIGGVAYPDIIKETLSDELSEGKFELFDVEVCIAIVIELVLVDNDWLLLAGDSSLTSCGQFPVKYWKFDFS